MKPTEFDIVVTTIFSPEWLLGYLENFEKYDACDKVTLRIICDKKTPKEVYAAAAQAQQMGFHIDCPSLDEQADYLKKLGLPADFIPWNSDNRRNIGFLRAWEHGARALISIDDDNYCLQGESFIDAHGIVGSATTTLPGSAMLASQAPWYNVCENLHAENCASFYARGFPYAARGASERATLEPLGSTDRRVAVNAGLWTDDPDVDAATRLVQGPRVISANSTAVLLDTPTWSPINTQNTALIRDAIPAYYYVRMGFPIQGMRIDRYGDILSGYFLQKCVKHLGDAICFGSPIAEHRRSPHNLFQDLYHELAGKVIVEDLLPWLQGLKLQASTYTEAYAVLADELELQASRMHGFIWDQGGQEFLRETAQMMRVWLKTLARIEGAA
nr:hypothetical protein [Oceanococcus sp. HetDA_MAG_MS8]